MSKFCLKYVVETFKFFVPYANKGLRVIQVDWLNQTSLVNYVLGGSILVILQDINLV
jgi:hypothetical protein